MRHVLTSALVIMLLTGCGGGSSSSEDGNGIENNEVPDDPVAPTVEPASSQPVLLLNGESTVVLELNDTYEDEGATAIDAEDGDISAMILVDGSVDTTTLGSYQLIYNVADSDGEVADPVSRLVNVIGGQILTVDTSMELDITTVEDPLGGAARPVGIVESLGKRAHLVDKEILITTDDIGVINGFLSRWPATLLETIEYDGAPNMHAITIDTSGVVFEDLQQYIDELTQSSLGEIRFSSDDTLKVFGIMAKELTENDLAISLNWVTTSQTVRSGSTIEQTSSGDASYTANAFAWPYMNKVSVQDTGVTEAWQMLDLLEVDRAVRVMIIDSGFQDIGDYTGAFTPAGAGWGSASGAGCSSDSCAWHGTDVAHVALATPDNGLGVAGSASKHGILEPVQFTGFDLRGLGRIFGILLSAPINGPPGVVNISGSVSVPPPFNVGLNRFLDPLFDRGLDLGILVVAAAGNDGEDVDDSFRFFFREIETSTVIPCETSSVVCVGGLAWDSNRLAAGSNFGSQREADSVDIYASYEYWVPELDLAGNDLASVRRKQGTSFSAPFVSGVLAMMKAANPSLDSDDAIDCLLSSAHDDGVSVHSRGGNQRRLDAFSSVVCALGRRVSFPLLSVDLPADGATVRGREDLVLNAASLGSEGEPLPIQWRSDRDGALGVFTSARDVVERGLSIGTHVLTAQVTDPNGASAERSVSVTVTNNPPSARILSPSENETFGPSQSIALRALVTDPDAFPSGELSGSQIQWSLSGNSFTTSGSDTSIPAGRLGVGDYTLTVEGNDGTDTVEATVNFSITECTGECPTVNITSPAGDIVTRSRTLDEEGRVFVDIEFTGVANDIEDGEFAGRLSDGPMFWTATNSEGRVTQICTPLSLGPPLVPVAQEQVCDTFTARLFLNELNSVRTVYVIALEVTDSDGNRATDSITVTLEFDLI